MVKETGYCNYYDREWVEKYSGLTYNQYRTKIEGNTFYIISNVLMESHITSFQRWVLNKIHISTLFCDHTVYHIPMIKAQEETIRDTLRSYNFNVKYKWLDEDLEPEYIKPLNEMIKISNRIIIKLYESDKTINDLRIMLEFTIWDMTRLLDGSLLLPPYIIEKIADYLGTTKQYLVNGDDINKSKKLVDSYIDELDCGDNGNVPAKKCPTCGYIDPCDFEDVYDIKYEYCPMCGQKLDRDG